MRPLLLILLLLTAPFSAHAALVINEIAWMGTEIDGVTSRNWWRYEWIELYNNEKASVSLEGWVLELSRDELDWSLALSGTIAPESYFLIVASDKISPDYDLNYSNLGGKFNNGGQKVLLKNNTGTVVEQIDSFTHGSWFAGDNTTKQTMERKDPSLSGDNSNNWQDSQNPGGTPKAKNGAVVAAQSPSPSSPEPSQPTEEPKEARPLSVPIEQAPAEQTTKEVPLAKPETPPPPVPPTYPAGIVLNEILPSPEGPDAQEEWIEIFNQNDFEVDLSGWKIKDSVGSVKTYTFPVSTNITPLGYLVLIRPTTKITLNNSGDTLYLIQPNEEILDSITFGKAPRAQSYNRTTSEWMWSTALTPGLVNVIPPPKVETKQPVSTKGAVDKEKTEAGPLSISTTGTAAVGEKVPRAPRRFTSTFAVALALAIASAVAMLILKKKLQSSDN